MRFVYLKEALKIFQIKLFSALYFSINDTYLNLEMGDLIIEVSLKPK